MFVNDLFKKKLNEGKANIDVPEIPRAPVPKPPKEKGVAEDFDDTHPYDSYVSAKRTVTSTGGNDKLSDKTASLDTDRFGNQRVRAVDGDKLTINTNIPKGVNVKMIPQQGAADIDEGSVQNKLHRRHQELRKKSGLPDPDYYKELKASYDIEDDAKRIAAQAEIKKKYRVAEGDTLDTGPDGKLTTKGEEQMRRYRQQKREQERQQIIAKHTKTVKGDTYGVAPSRISQSRNEVNWAAANKELRKKGLDEQGVAEGNLNEFAPGDGNSGRWYSDDDLADIVGEDWYEFDLSHEMGNIGTQGERARIFLAQQAEAYLNDRGYNVNVLDVRDQGDNLSWYISGSLMNEQGVAEGLPQTLRKVVPGYAKREIDKKMDAGKFGKTDADKDANFQRYKKIQDKLKEQGVAEGVEQYLEEMRRAGYDIVTEAATLCPECGGPAYNNQMLAEKQDACYHKVKSRYKVWPSAYASGALVRCRKKGAKNWGNKSKK
jgi:hypothetical protein